MFEIIKSSWFVGIATGLISGLLVYVITNSLMKKKSKEEYYKKVSDANRDVIMSLKPYIPEKGLPDVEIFKAIIASTSRTYSIKSDDMFSIAVFCEELIREIISDVYVSADKKQEYTNNLIKYKEELQKATVTHDFEIKYIGGSDEYRRKMPLYLAMMCAMFAMMLSLMGMTFSKNTSFWYPFDTEPMLWIPIFTVMLIVVDTTLMLVLDRLIKNKRIKRTKNEYIKYYDNFYSKKKQNNGNDDDTGAA